MIVTRQRKQKKSSLPILLPIAAIVMLAVALTWPPSRNWIVTGPLKPVANVVIGASAVVARPLSFAYQQQQITDRNVQIKALSDKLETERKSTSTKDAQVTQLQKQMAAAAAEPAPSTPTPAKPIGAPGGAGGAPGAAAVPAVDPALKRTADQWAAMDPDRVALVVAKLPAPYVASVFAQMPPDSVGPVMDAMPSALAAKIVQSNPPAGGNPQISAQSRR